MIIIQMTSFVADTARVYLVHLMNAAQRQVAARLVSIPPKSEIKIGRNPPTFGLKFLLTFGLKYLLFLGFFSAFGGVLLKAYIVQ